MYARRSSTRSAMGHSRFTATSVKNKNRMNLRTSASVYSATPQALSFGKLLYVCSLSQTPQARTSVVNYCLATLSQTKHPTESVLGRYFRNPFIIEIDSGEKLSIMRSQYRGVKTCEI